MKDFNTALCTGQAPSIPEPAESPDRDHAGKSNLIDQYLATLLVTFIEAGLIDVSHSYSQACGLLILCFQGSRCCSSQQQRCSFGTESFLPYQ